VHDYKIPNNPDANEWNNLCLEDIGIYWELPNFDEAKYYYFHCVDLDGQNAENQAITPVRADTRDELINEFYGWKLHESRNKQMFIPASILAAGSLAFAAFAL